jgi:hypothetical protein
VPRTSSTATQERAAEGLTKGVALVTYKAKGIQRHVIYWGAASDRAAFFRYDRSGGAVSKKVKNWRKMKNACKPYPGRR